MVEKHLESMPSSPPLLNMRNAMRQMYAHGTVKERGEARIWLARNDAEWLSKTQS
jgi:hypothetical protein